MLTNITTFSVTDLRQKTAEVLEETKKQQIVYVLSHSKPLAALVDVAYFQALQKAYEEYLDTLEFDETIGQKRISLDDHKRRRAQRV